MLLRKNRTKPSPTRRAKRPVEIVDLLRDRILRDEIRAGDRLPAERRLAQDLSTNRNTLREALRTLDALGLTRARHGDGVQVLDFRRSGTLPLLPHYFRVADDRERVRVLADLLRFRATMAQEVAVLAARRGSRDDFECLDKLIGELESALLRRDMRALGETELDIYRALAEAGGSIAAIWVLNGLEPVVRDLLAVSPQLWMVSEDYIPSWREIASAISQRDEEEARRILSGLLDRGDRRLLDAIDPSAAAPGEGVIEEDAGGGTRSQGYDGSEHERTLEDAPTGS